MLIQLVLGVMNLAVMVVVSVAIALEKLLPRGERVARAIGLNAITVGVVHRASLEISNRHQGKPQNLKTFIHWLRCLVTKAELLP